MLKRHLRCLGEWARTWLGRSGSEWSPKGEIGISVYIEYKGDAYHRLAAVIPTTESPFPQAEVRRAANGAIEWICKDIEAWEGRHAP